MGPDLLGNLPDWLQILLAIAGLGGGAGVGTYQAAVRRTRLDDRRKLLLELNEPLASILQRGPSFEAAGDTRAEQIANWRQRNLDEIAEINRLFQLLPWRDRSLWIRYLSDVLARGGEPLLGLLRYSSMLLSDELALHVALAGDLEGEGLVDRLRGFIESHDEEVNRALGSRGSSDRHQDPSFLALRHHLVRAVNPSKTSRFFSALVTLDLWMNGPRPISPHIRPDRIEISYQLQRVLGEGMHPAWESVS